jgi:hypothetical protein
VVRRNFGRDIFKIIIDTQIEHPEWYAMLTSQAVGARDASDESAHHCRRHLPRIRGNSVVGHAMITSQDHRSDPVQGARWTCRLAGRHPRGQVL